MTTTPVFTRCLRVPIFTICIDQYKGKLSKYLSEHNLLNTTIQTDVSIDMPRCRVLGNATIWCDKDHKPHIRATGSVEMANSTFHGIWSDEGFVSGILAFYDMMLTPTAVKVKGHELMLLPSISECSFAYRFYDFNINLEIVNYSALITVIDGSYTMSLASRRGKECQRTNCPFLSDYYIFFDGFIQGYGKYFIISTNAICDNEKVLEILVDITNSQTRRTKTLALADFWKSLLDNSLRLFYCYHCEMMQ